MTRWGALTALLASLVVLVVAPAPAASAAGWTDGACPTADGVTVVVDFSAFGGNVVVRCAPGAQRNGLDALANAGFPVAQPLSTPGFVCRIDDRPGPDEESCAATPPADAYWAYWRADRGGAWKYSRTGAASSGTAPAGGVQGWAFTRGPTAATPGVAPPAAPAPVTAPPTAPPTTPAAAPSPSPASGPAAGGTGSGSGPAAGSSGGAVASSSSGARVAGASTSAAPVAGGQAAGGQTPAPGAAPVPAPGDTAAPGAGESAPSTVAPGAGDTAAGESTTTTNGPADDVELAAASGRTGSTSGSGGDAGSPLPTILVVLALVTLGGATAVVARRRGN